VRVSVRQCVAVCMCGCLLTATTWAVVKWKFCVQGQRQWRPQPPFRLTHTPHPTPNCKSKPTDQKLCLFPNLKRGIKTYFTCFFFSPACACMCGVPFSYSFFYNFFFFSPACACMCGVPFSYSFFYNFFFCRVRASLRTPIQTKMRTFLHNFRSLSRSLCPSLPRSPASAALDSKITVREPARERHTFKVK